MSSSESSTSGSTSSVDPPIGEATRSVDGEELIEAINRPRQVDDPINVHRGRLPYLDLPSFGEPDRKCGEPVPGSTYFCPNCATVHEKPHICYRYDCPIHWPHAVRRRASGSSSGIGAAPKLDALRRYLNDFREDNQYFHHLVISPPDDLQLAAGDPLERALEVIRELMDLAGIQGLVAYHPYRGDDETPGDDRGEWQNRIHKNTEWDDVREELRGSPHFHLIGVAPFVDFSDSPLVEDETGWVLHRITQENSNISISDDEAMARAVTYALSHAGIYDSESGQRRLAAWMKGPDVDKSLEEYQYNRFAIKRLVEDVATDTLGISPSSMRCDEELVDADRRYTDRIENPDGERADRRGDLPELERPSQHRDPPILATPEGPRGPNGPTIASLHNDPTVRTDGSSSSSSSRSRRANGSTNLPPSARDLEFGSSTSTSSRTSAASSRTSRASAAREEPSASSSSNTEKCDTTLRHISEAGDYLFSLDWRESVENEGNIEQLDKNYRSYIFYLRVMGLDVEDDRPTIPEEREGEPPPDASPAD